MKNQKEIIEVIEPKKIFVGEKTAPVTIMEFGDYESEACLQANEVVKQLLETYTGKVKFIFRHFPLLKIHQKAHKAAEASIAASQDGKFWEMHNALFANRRNLGVISLKSYAKDIGITNKEFLNNLINGVFGWYVQGDLMEGIKLGVKDVPTFFINGEKFEQEPTLKNLSNYINGLLNDSGKKKTTTTTKKRSA